MPVQETDMSATDRLVALMDHLRLGSAYFGTAIPRLARHFTVVTLGGPHLGGVASLEDRARMPTYQAMFRRLIDQIGPRPGEAILEIGCGACSLVCLLARRLRDANPIQGGAAGC